MRYDVIIIGAGPAGIFSALELSKRKKSVVILEKGKDITKRRCPAREEKKECQRCKVCEIIYGWGGAGAFSDGKLILSPDIGGLLPHFVGTEIDKLIKEVDKIFLHYGATNEVYGENEDEVEKLQRAALKVDLTLTPSRVRHLGTESCREILSNMKRELNGKVDIRTKFDVDEIITEDKKVIGVRGKNGEKIRGKYVICGPGRGGADWLQKEATRLGLTTKSNPVDVGVRIELPAVVMEKITSVVYEPKLTYYSKYFDDRIRLFCMNPYGEVVTEYSNGIVTVNGHSYKDKKTNNTNFALLVSTTFTEPFNEPIKYGEYIASLANMLGKGVIVQRLGDLRSGRRSTHERMQRGIVKPTLKDATPGDLSFILPYRYLPSILEMLDALDRLAPGVNSPHTLLYGAEVKFYSLQLKINSRLETEIKNLYTIGDGGGITRGLVQAAASGLYVGRMIK